MPDYTPSTDLMPGAQVERPDPAMVDQIVAMVAEAERPIILGGRGAMWSGAKGALESLAQESGALLATTLLGKGLFDGNPFALDIAGTSLGRRRPRRLWSGPRRECTTRQSPGRRGSATTPRAASLA